MKNDNYLSSMLKYVFTLLSCILISGTMAAQVTVSGGTPAAGSYTTISAAVTALNGAAATANITVDVLAGHSETAPAGGIALGSATLNGSLAAGSYTLTIQKNGAGANPVINAYAGGTATPTSAIQDGIFRLVGTDNVTIDGIDLFDGNAANPATMEYGYGLFKLSASDGCQNNIIKNCTITLNRINNATGGTLAVDGSRGINMVNALPATQTTAVTPSSILGTNSGNKFYSNTIQNCNIGMALIGYAAASPFILADKNTDVGGSSSSTGNIIRNFGGAASATNPSAGIRTLAQYDLNISFNTVNNNDGGGVNHVSTLRGIYLNTATSANATVTYNTVTTNGGGTSSQVSAIENLSGSTPLGNTINISYNTIANCTYSTATTGAFYAIYNNGASPANLSINNNTLSNNSTAATSGSFYNIYNTGSITGNTSFQNNIIDMGTFIAPVSTSLANYNIYNSGTHLNLTISGNTLKNFNATGTTGHTGTIYFIYMVGSMTASGTELIQNNTYSNLNIKSTGTWYLLYGGSSMAFNTTISGNSIVGGLNRTATGGSGTVYFLYGYNSSSSPTSGTSINYHSNNFSNFNNGTCTGTVYLNYLVGGGYTFNYYNNTFDNINAPSGTGTLYCIYGPYYYQKYANMYNNTWSNISYGGTVYGMYFYMYYTESANVYNNTWRNITTGGANLYGIYVYYTGGFSTIRGPYNIYNNTLTDLTTTNTNGVVNGIIENYRYYGGTVNVYNNLIGNLFAPNSSNANAVNGIRLQPYDPGDNSTMTSNYYYNTVYLTGTSTASGFGSSAFNADNYTAGSATFRNNYTLNNNIFINNTVPTGSGLAVGHRLQNPAYLSKFAGSSNNNIWYVSSGASNLYFYDGVSSDATFPAYQARVTTRENASQNENVDFISTTGSSSSFLKPVGFHTFVESYGANIGGITTDFAGTVRQGNAGYSGTGTAPDIGAWEINGTPPPICSGTPDPGTIAGPATVCANSGTSLSLSGGNTSDLYMSYQWAYSTTPGGPYTNLGTFSTQPTGPLTTPTYYICTMTCTQPGGGTAVTPEKSIGIVAQPVVTTNISTALFCASTPANYTLIVSGADTYVWTPSTGLTGGTTNDTVTVAPASSLTYTVTGTQTSTGCSNTATVFANRAPAVQVTATASPYEICNGSSSTLTASAGFLNNYCTSQASSTADEEIYSITVNGSSTPAAYAGANGCGTIAPGPGSMLSRYSNFTTLGALTNLAAGSSSSFTVEENECDGATFYPFGTAIWIDYNQNGSFADAGEQIFVESTTATGPRNVTGSFVVPATAYNGLTRMRVIVAEGVSGSGLTPCLGYGYGETEDWFVNITGGVDNSVPVTWSPSTFLSSTTGTPVTASNVTATTIYTATAISAAGCTASDTVILIGGVLATNITASAGTICQLQSSVLTANVPSGAGPYTYLWSTGETTKSITVSPMTTTVYSVAVTGSCEGPVTSAPFTVTVEPVPVVNVSTGYSVYCYGSTTPITLTASGDGTSYAWSPAIGINDTTLASVSISGISNTQTYTVVSTLGNCTSSKTSTVRVPGPIYLNATATPDAVCQFGVSLLEASVKTSATYQSNSETPAPIPTPGTGVTILNNTTPVTSGNFNNGFWQAALPFRASFYDNGYDNIYIGTNGYVSFPQGYTVATPTAIPSASSPDGAISLAWKDWNMTSAGSIQYFTTGTAPNRVFVVKYVSVPPASGSGTLNGQIEIYENGNIVLFLASVDGSSTKSLGIESPNGTDFQSFSSRNGVAWTISTPEMWKFTASGGQISYNWTTNNILNPLVDPTVATTETYPITVLPASFAVVVTDTTGCTNTDTLSVIEGLTMNVNILTANTTVCLGSTVTLRAQVLGGGPPYTFTWDDGINTIDGPGANQEIQVTPALGFNTYNVTVSDFCTGVPASGTITINVLPLPVLSVTPSSGTACGTDSLTLVASGSSTSYIWSPATGLGTTIGNTVKSQPPSYNTSITYTVTGTDVNGCQSSATVPVKRALPVTVTASALPTDVCSGSNSQLNGLATVPNNIVIGTGTSSSSTSAGPLYLSSATSTFRFSKHASIYTASEIVAAGGGPGALTNIAWYIANSTGGHTNSDATFRIWMKHVTFSTHPNTTVTFATEISGATLVYSSTTQNLNTFIGWQDFPLQTPFIWNGSDNIEILVEWAKPSNSVGPVNWQYTTKTNANAITGSTTSPATASRNSNRPNIRLTFPVSFTYNWSPITYLSNPAISNPVAQNVTISQLYTFTATSNDGCSASATASVEVKPLSVSDISASSSIVCQDSSVTLSATGDGGGPPYSFTWKEGSTVLGTGSSITVTPTSVGNHIYTVYIDDLCGSPTASASVTVNEVAKPNVTVTKSGDICGSGSVTLTASGANIYVWSPATNLSAPTSAVTTASPSITTSYVVYGTSLLTGCTSISDPVTVFVHLLPSVTATASPNPILLNANTQLNAAVTQNSNYGYTVTSIPFAGRDLTAVSGIGGGIGDEPNTSMPLGFNFNFYGNNYTGVTFHGNGQILMGLGNTSADFVYSPPSSGIPTAAAPNNWVGYWVDQNTSATSQVEWGVVGVAPNRKLVVRANAINYYSSTPANTYQYELHETTNYIDVYMVDNTTTSTLFRQIGMENSTGTMGVAAPGRSYGQWTATSEAWRFAPVSFGAPAFTYSWSPSTYLDATTISNPYATAVGGVTTYTVNVTNTTTGCNALPATVQVLAGVTLTVDATSPDTVLCLGESATLNSVVAGGGVPYIYSWSDGVAEVGNTPGISVSPSVTTLYTLTVTDVGTAAVSAYITVVVNPLPVISVTPPGGSICNSTIGVTMTAAGNSNSYGWTPSAGLSSTTAATVTANPAITTIYTVTGTIFATGCKNTAIQTVHKANLAVNASAAPYSVCYEQNGQLNSTASNSLSSYSVASIPYGDKDISTVTGIGAALGDEGNINVNLGFTFNYFGNNYTGVTIHANGQILMGSGNTTANNVYSPPTAFPSTANPNNWCGFWADLQVDAAGQITYGVVGTAPNRKLIVRFNNVNYYFSTPAITYQIELNESTNIIDMFVTSSTSGGNTRLLALENSTGTIGTVAPGRSTGVWNANNEGWRFTPAGTFAYSWTPTVFLNDPAIKNPSITAITDTTVYTLTITEPASGCQLSDTAKVNAVPLPTVELAGSDSICVNTSTNLVFTFTGLAPFTYSYTDGINTYGPLTSATNVATVSVAPAGVAGESFTYTPVSVYDARCTGTEESLSGSATLYLLARSSDAGLSVTSNKPFNNICTGDQITISIQGVSSTSLGYQATWKWYTGSCGTGIPVPNSTGKTSITVAPTVNTTYYVRAEGYCNNTLCLSLPVIVSTAPPSGNPSITSYPALAYPGASDSIKVAPVPGAVWYRWSTGGNTQLLFNGKPAPYQSTSPNVLVTFLSSATQGNGIGNYHISMFAGNACGRTNSSNLQVRSTVAAPAALTGPDVACVGQTRSYSITPITGAKSYQWSFTAGSGTIVGNGTTAVNVTFTGLPATLCVHGVTAFNTDGPDLCINVTTNILAPGPISGDTTPCQGTTSSYSVAPVVGAISYEWTVTGILGTTITTSMNTANISFPVGSFSGTILVRAYSGCGYSGYSTLAVVNGAPAPIGTISGPTTGLCGVNGVNFQIPSTGDTIYSWTVPPGATITSGNGTNSILVNFGNGFAGGSISVQASNDCGSITGYLAVTGAPATPTLTGATSVCAGDPESYVASSNGATNYTWLVDTVNEAILIPGSSPEEVLISWITSGTVGVIASNSCGASDTAFLSVSITCRVAGSNGMPDALKATVYPNPSHGAMTLQYSSPEKSDYLVKVTDLTGRVVYTESLSGIEGMNQHDLDLSSLAKGMYKLSIEDAAGQSIVMKVVIE